MKDLALDPLTGGLKGGVLTMDDALLNNVYLSMVIPRGSWWAAPEFGSRLHLVKKLTPTAPRLAKDYCEEALRWIVAAGRAASIGVTAEADEIYPRVNCLIKVTKNDGQTLDYTHFVRVG